MSDREIILNGLKPLFETADRNKMMFQCTSFLHPEIRFFPNELRKHHKNGKFVFSAENWVLIDPSEITEKLSEDLYAAERAVVEFQERIANARNNS